MNATASDMVILGEVTSPFGTDGWLKIKSFTDPPQALFEYDELFYQLQGYWFPLQIIDYQAHKNHFLVSAQQAQTYEQARLLNHCVIATPRCALPETESDSYYWHDLIGLATYNQQHNYLGQITGFLPTGQKDVMIIEDQQRYLIPFVIDVFVLQVDLTNQHIIVDWDSGTHA